MILTAADAVVAALDDLPPDIRSIVEAHLLDGDSCYRIQRHVKMKRKDVEVIIAAGLAAMRAALKGRGIVSMADLL